MLERDRSRWPTTRLTFLSNPRDSIASAVRVSDSRILFVTKFSISPVTALGVQTQILMRAFPQPINLYWATPKFYFNSRTKVRLENALIARAGRLQGDQRIARLVRSLGFSWWRSNVLKDRRTPRVDRLRNRITHVYMAPIDEQDAARMRLLARQLGRPFVLHLWDSFSGPLASDPNLLWLIRNAGQVLALSAPLLDDIRQVGVEAKTLLFTRSPTSERASAPRPEQPLRIALLGLLDPYADGVVMLVEALDILASRGIAADIVYIGSERAVEQVNLRLKRKLVPTGFLSDDERDATLASCNLGFLPGPSADPASDMRSRYSIPSRSMDFFAVGLPVVGTTHPRSATARFYAALGFADLVTQSNAVSLADAIFSTAKSGQWHTCRTRVDAAWHRLQADSPAEQLRLTMAELAERAP